MIQVLARKPDPAPVLAFAAAVNVPPADIAVVGDTTHHDLDAARAAGARRCGRRAGRDVASGLSARLRRRPYPVDRRNCRRGSDTINQGFETPTRLRRSSLPVKNRRSGRTGCPRSAQASDRDDIVQRRLWREFRMLGLMQDWPLMVPQDPRPRGQSCTATARWSPARSRGRSCARPTRASPARPQRGARRCEARRQARRPRRHPGLEHGPPHRGLVRDHGHRRGLPHAQPAPVPEQLAYIINHAEDRFLFTDLTFVPLLAKLAGPSCRRSKRYRRHDRPRAHAADEAAQRRSLTRTCRSPRSTTTSPGRLRREHRLRPLLHLRHDGQPQGRALLAPLQRPARADAAAAPTHSACAAPTRCCRSCRCSTPTPGRSPSRRRWSAPSW